MTSVRHRAPLLVAALLTAACATESGDAGSETWGFVATLGSDTTSVERVTRTGDRLSGVAIGRSPAVVRRTWEATLAPDGTIRSWSMDTHIANAPAGQNELHHELEVTGNGLRLVRRTGSDSTDRRVTSPYERTVPWNAFLYSTMETLLQAAGDIADTTRIGVYFFEGWAEGNLGWALLRPIADGRIGVRSSGLSGEGEAMVDSAGRLLSYSGQGTTYKQEVVRVDEVPDLDAIFQRFAADERTRGVGQSLSNRDTARATIDSARILIDYSRPLLRGRTLLGELIPYDRVWRTGANAATQLITSAPIVLGGQRLEAGAYTLWTLPSRSGVQLIINRETGQWGTGYRSEHDIARIPMQVDELGASVERFSIVVDPLTNRLTMEWGTFRWSVPLEAGG